MTLGFFTPSGRLQVFGSPIDTAVSFVALLPLLYITAVGMRSKRLVRVGCLASCVLVILGVALTRSRGPYISILTSCLVMIVLPRWFGSIGEDHCAKYGRWGVLFWLVGLAAGPASRLGVERIATDGSIVNRLHIWKAGFDLIASSGFAGVGSGNGGYLYSQWFQPERGDYQYLTLYNGGLELAVEHGVVVFLVAAMLLTFLLLTPLNSSNRTTHENKTAIQRVRLACYLEICGLLVCSCTSTIPATSLAGLLFILSCAILTLLEICCRPYKELLRTFTITASVITILAYSSFLVCSEPNAGIRVKTDPNRLTTLNRANRSANTETALVVVDVDVLGALYGKSIRALLSRAETLATMFVPDPRFPMPKDLPSASTLIVFGSSSKAVNPQMMQSAKRLILVHPVEEYSDRAYPAETLVYLPRGDLWGVNDSWRAAAKRGLLSVVETTAFDQRLDIGSLAL